MRSVRDPIHIQVRPVAVCPKNTAVTTTLTGRALFVLVLLTHHRRRVLHLAITEHPTTVWTAQQIARLPSGPLCSVWWSAGETGLQTT